MVRRLLALAGVAIDDAPAGRRGHGCRRQDQIDPHAPTLMEVAGAVVPPREALRRGHVPAEDVLQTQASISASAARSGGLVCVWSTNFAASYTSSSGSDVEVAGHDDGLVSARGSPEVAPEPGQPVELVAVVLVVESPPVRDVHGADPDAGTRDREQPGVQVRWIAVGEAGHDVIDADSRQHRDPVPLALAVVGGGVAEGLESQSREAAVGQLRLLHADDVGLHLGQPGLHARLADPQRVDVPRGQPRRLYRSGGRGLPASA